MNAHSRFPEEMDAIERAFWLFHGENPSVYDEIAKIARELKARGRTHYGIKCIFEVVRFHRALQSHSEPFKLNNNYSALYARLLMKNEPDLSGFFSTRRRECESAEW